MKYTINPQEREKFKELIKTDGKKILYYHQDTDGIVSAALLLKFFQGFEYHPKEGPRTNIEFFEKMVEERPSLIVFLDIPIDQEADKIKSFLEQLPEVKMIIIDHHIFDENLNSDKILHVNPMFSTREYIANCYVLYMLLNELGFNLEKYKWMVGAGIVGDHAFEHCKEFLDQLKGYDLLKVSELMTADVTYRGLGGASEALEILLRSKDYDDFIGNKTLIEYSEIVRKEIDYIMDDFEKNKEVDKDLNLIAYTIKSEFKIASIISSLLAKKYVDEIIIIKKKSDFGWKLSLRCQSGNYNMGDLAKKCSKGIGSGGGHVKAAGVLITDWDEFKERFISYLKSA